MAKTIFIDEIRQRRNSPDAQGCPVQKGTIASSPLPYIILLDENDQTAAKATPQVTLAGDLPKPPHG
ncbi:hypothetical protein [Desulfosarcina sp.]|uniref:hypothetical protein n=1 Tax=Desulfosarcina sp. TaxID=2027861 RepID=UPI00397068AC